MITLGTYVIEPMMLALLGGAVVLLMLLFFGLRASNRAARAAEPLANQMLMMGDALRILNESQHVLKGGLDSLSQSQAQSMQTVEARLSGVQQQMQEKLHENALRSARSLADLQAQMRDTLHGSSEKTTKSLTQLQERLATIDKAQVNIEKLSSNVLSLQDILSNKQTRGAFGEIQLNDIVRKAMPPDAFSFQQTLSNGKRADCLIHLPNPPGPIVIDSKFPLEAYEAIRAAENPAQVQLAARDMRTALRAHIKAISEKYIIEGETADGALLFLPSEAVYAELHANFPEVVREGFAARVWIVSPTTCMATLNTMRAVLKDARMKEQAGAIRTELGLLHKDVERLESRVFNLDRHFGQASKDIEEIKISATKAGGRARRLEAIDFDPIEDDIADPLTPIAGDK
ncbi:DNA recombination protein RmuC [Roseobacter sp. N2S]|uniref:DNA recombination protein RmuC n=1 Tax=Roseobacter sp. N2S TaxID=2663844 RepID=UPI00285CEC5D|nr:DNA recombination protein RmuC [Roseobacter sp. N2S]MDR6266145.1 DNA recombination protein RmuC [Roseobacter sp. N2S]